MATKKKRSSQSRSKQNSRSRNGANGRSASGNGRSRSGTKSKDVIALLKEDHANVRELLGKLVEGKSAAQKSRHQLFTEIEMEIELHARVEEEIVYPAFLEIVERSDRHIFFEAQEEHALVRRVMDEMDAGTPEDEEFTARAKVLKDLVEHHAKEEEREMFPLLKSETEPERLREMAAEVEARKQELRPEFEGRYQHAH